MRSAIADRFGRARGVAWIDLATGRRVTIRTRPIGAAGPARGWRDRLSALVAVWHPHLLTPIDYGLLGRSGSFEAWPVSEPIQRPQDRRTALAIRSAVAFLSTLGLTTGRADWRRTRTHEGRVVLLPDSTTGLRAGAEAESGVRLERQWQKLLGRFPDPPGTRILGVRLQERSAVRWVADILDGARPGEMRSVALLSQRGAGVSTLVQCIAREARLRGYLPLDVGVAAAWGRLEALVCDRHVLLIDRSGLPHSLERVVLSPALRQARGCVVLRLSRGCDRSGPVQGRMLRELELDAVPASRLAASVIAYPPGAVSPREISEAARQADGQPGRFLMLLQGARGRPSAVGRSDVLMVHESTTVYSGSGEAPAETAAPPRTCDPHPGPVLAHALWRAQQARAFARRGRHAAAERSWRAALGAFARRGCGHLQSEAALELAGLLAARGRTRDALAVAQQGCADAPPLVQLRSTLLMASLLTDEARLAEAEATARAAQLATGRTRGSPEDVAGALGLARCLMWQGRVDESRRAIQFDVSNSSPLAAAVLARRARIEVLRSNLADAGRAAAAAVAAAEVGQDPRVRATAAAAMATVLAWVGDESGFRQQVNRGLIAARQTRAPLTLVRLHLVFADGCVRLGLTRESRPVIRTLGRWALGQVPPLLRARVQHALGRMGDADARTACDEFVRATGALGVTFRTGEDRTMEGLQELSDVLRICHESPDELAALNRVCATLRDSLKATSVAVVAGTDGLRALAGAGAAWAERSDVSERVLASGHVIPPVVTCAGLEAAAPFRYAGRTVGALAARWPIDAHEAARHGMTRLVTAAAATAPSLRAALDRLATPMPLVSVAMPALLGTSPAIQAVREAAIRAARAPFAVLIEGESGSGKELVARAVHEHGDRRARRLCAINCAALGEDLLEAELFGHARGAFTGAIAERPGLFEEADGGTLLLDEVSELSPRAQAKLLRAIQEGEIRRVGESLHRKVDVRLIAASNRRLEDQVASGRFRADLRYRLEVIRIVVPPLRQRTEDIPLLASHFWDQAVKRTGGRATLDPTTFAALARYEWPGNVRELQNVMTSLAVHAGSRGRVGPQALPDHIAGAPVTGESTTLCAARHSFERRFVRAVLAQEGGHRGRAARALGLSRQGLAKLLRRLEIDPALMVRPTQPGAPT